MNTEIMTTIGTGIAILAIIVPGQRSFQREMRRDIGDLRQRMARLEGQMSVITDFLKAKAQT